MEEPREQVTEAAQALSELGAAKGGRARAAVLSPEDRREIARIAAEKRWGTKPSSLPRETHEGTLKIGDREIPCSVLENGTRVFSITGLSSAMGSKMKGGGRTADGSFQLPPFLASASLRPFISNDLLVPLMSPILYKPKHGGRAAVGYEATLLPQICEVILDAAKAGVLRRRSSKIVQAAEILIRGFARVGIIALIDEATGYQADRARDELNKILQAYIAKELLPWTKRFPDEFFRQIYRLRKWDYREGSHKRPRIIGQLVKKLVYEPLPPGVLHELERKNPPDEKGYRRHRHHQFLTPETGHPHLDRQIVEVTTLMRVSDDEHAFRRLFDKAFPKKNQQLPIEWKEDGEEIS